MYKIIEVYLGAKGKTGPHLTSSLQIVSAAYKKEEERRKRRNIPEELYDYIEKGVEAFTNIDESTVIVYDERKKGIQYSLARLSLEITKIKRGKDFNPIFIENPNQLNEMKTDESGYREGIYVFDPALFVENEDYVEKAFEETGPSLMGYQFKVFIVPFSLYRKYMLHLSPHYLLVDEELASENKKAIQYSLTNELLTALAYGASGLDLDFKKAKSFEVLKQIDASFNLIYNTAKTYLKEKYGPNYDVYLHKASVGGVESSQHKGLKDVIVYYLIKNEGLDVKDVKVEERLESSQVPDVQARVKGKYVAIDAKTSFGKDPIHEINETYEKYSKNWDDVWIVLRPLPALLYAERIAGLLTLEKFDKLQVLIPVKDDDKNGEKSVKLISFEDFLKEVKKAYDELKGKIS
ncbi:MAG: hypothetical protein MPF33_06350 [Candidatus Aramenus sp.]|jgi:hypothetical protein|nr:hypothetical protein [Candidatus Aramenus sp.]